jgi:hypothetical protein
LFEELSETLDDVPLPWPALLVLAAAPAKINVATAATAAISRVSHLIRQWLS